MKPKTLSQRQQRMLDYLKEFKAKFDGRSPTRRQIGAACDISSTSVVSYHLTQLERMGYIMVEDGARAIRVVGGRWSMEDG